MDQTPSRQVDFFAVINRVLSDLLVSTERSAEMLHLDRVLLVLNST